MNRHTEKHRQSDPSENSSLFDHRDDYPEYIHETAGYAYRYADIKSPKELRRHFQFTESLPSQVPELSELTEFEVWGIARAAFEDDNRARFIELCEHLLTSDDDDPGLNYREISVLKARELIFDEQFDSARDSLDRHLRDWPESPFASIASALLPLLDEGDDDATRAELDEVWNNYHRDPDIYLDIVEILMEFNCEAIARTWLEEAPEQVFRADNHPAVADLELLRRSLT